MNVFDLIDFKIIVDYGHNVAAISSTGDFLRSMATGDIIRMAAGVGDRRTEDIIDFGKRIAQYSDYVVITDPSSRRRKLGETAELVKKGMLEQGFNENKIELIINEYEK